MATYSSIRYVSSGGAGVTVYANFAAFPASPSEGDLAYANDTDALYVRKGSSWNRIDSGEEAPVILTEPSTTHALPANGSTNTVTMTAQDPEGFDIVYGIAYNTANNARPTQLSSDTTINQSTGVYTFTPSTNSAHAGSFKARLSASDGANTTTRFVNISLEFAIEVLLAAGGGGGNEDAGGGGGAGGLVLNTNYGFTAGTTYNIVVGAGGAVGSGQSGRGVAGGDSTFSAGSTLVYTATGGAGGGPYPAATGEDGGSGAGAGRATSGQAGASTQASYGGLGFGNAGGDCNSNQGAGGGGGAGGAGQTAPSLGQGGAGGAGKASTITGSSVFYCPGGPGWGYSASQGAYTDGTASSYGAGGTGGDYGGSLNAAAGAAGVCIVASKVQASSTTGSPSVSTSSRSGYYVYTFTSNGSITF